MPKRTQEKMARERLPNRHMCESIDYVHGGRPFTCQFSRFPDGRIAEVFLSGMKAGSELETFMRDICVSWSISFQNGVRPTDIRMSLCRNSNGTPSGPAGKLMDILAAEERKAETIEHNPG